MTGAPLTDEVLQETVERVQELGRRGAAEAIGLSYPAICNRLNSAIKRGLVSASGLPDKRSGKPGGTKRRRKKPAAAAGPSLAPKRRSESDRRRGQNDSAELRHLWWNYIDGGRQDVALRNELIEVHLPDLERLAMKMAWRLPDRNHIAEDLMAAGVMGLMDAAARYEPEDAAFWTFAQKRCWGAMVDHLRKIDHLNRDYRRCHKERAAATARLTQELGRVPNDEELREELGWDSQAWLKSQEGHVVSGDAPLYGKESTTALAMVEEYCDPDAGMLRRERFRILTRSLSLDQQTVLHLYYAHAATMKSIGQAMGLSESRVSQLVSDAKVALRREHAKQEREAG